jgi:hypothetical protein
MILALAVAARNTKIATVKKLYRYNQKALNFSGLSDYIYTVSLPWQFLYFLPLPHGQGSLRPILGPTFIGSCFTAILPATLPDGS